MKKLLSFLIVLLVSQLLWAQNQILTTITPKVSLFPSSGLSYLDDPERYFNIQMINTSGNEMQIYFTISLSCEFSATGESFFVYTKPEYQPNTPITIGGIPLMLNRNHFDQMVGNLNASAYETNIDRSKLVNNMFTLPEGQYRFCIKPYIWTGRNDLNPTAAGDETCYTFSICYTGSAPEFTTPVNGLTAGNSSNNLQTPIHSDRLNSDISNGSIQVDRNHRLRVGAANNTAGTSYTRLPLSRQLIFNWTGVISNCLSTNDFDYILKIVEVYANQNVQDAINLNSTLATYNNKSQTVYIHDTVTNRHFQLVPGHVYAAQVQAVLKKSMMSDVKLGNDGKSQIITFVWGENTSIVQGDELSSQIHSATSDNHDQVLQQIQNPCFVAPGQDKSNTNNLSQSSQTQTNSPYPYITNVDAGDSPYYQVPISDTLAVQWIPVCGDSVIKVVYTTELYEYNGGEIANSMIGLPLKSASVTVQAPHDFSPGNGEVMSVSSNSWTDMMEEGNKYVLHLKAETYYSYEKKTTYTITDFIHNMPKDRDSVVTEVAFASSDLYSNVVFAWGIDSDAMDKVYPAQFTYPMDLSTKNWDDTLMTKIPEVAKHKDFKFKWEAAKGVHYGDTAYYKLLVAKLPKGKKPQQVKDTLFIKDSITATSYMDTILFDSLKTDEQYMAVLWTYIGQNGAKNDEYNLVNKGKSIYATFKLVPPREYTADLNSKIKCSPNALENLSKDTITPKADSLVENRVQLMMGDFPLVMQTATLDTAKKRYSGDGYVIWHPIGIDVPLKVHFDSIQINKDYQIINGTAVSTVTDSSTYLSALLNDLDLEEWSEDDINRIASQFGSEDDVKKYYDAFKKYGEKYGKKYGGLLGPLVGKEISSQVMAFPLCITDEEFSGSENIIFSINNMFFSPVTALMNIWAIFAAQDDDSYVPFLANNICMDQQGLLGKSDQHIDLFMARSYEKKLDDGYVLRFKASSNFADPKDGTVISIDSGKLNHITAEIQLDLNNNDFLGIDKDGTPRKGKIVQANMIAKFTSWSNWVAKASMDPFAVAGADRFTFVPTGKGIFYDHSTKETPNEVSLTYEYLFGTPPPQEMKEEDRKKLTKATKEWKGFYWDELTVFLSDEISNTFTDKEQPKDSVVVYRYGLNNTVTDSVHYCYPGSRINFGAKGLIIDENGFTSDFYAHDILKASTKEGWGWSFSLDTISLRFTKNQYKQGIIKGGFDVPLFKGGFSYDCSIGSDSLMFNVQPVKDTMALDLWLADVNFVKESSYFRIKKLYKESGTRIDLTLNGNISLKTSELGLPADFKAVKFEGMGMRNYNLANPQAGTASANGFEFTIGKWAFASPQKYIGGSADGVAETQQTNDLGSVSFCGFTFSLKKIEPIAEANGDDLKLGVKVTGQMKFATEGADLGATTGFSLWGVTDTKNKFRVKDVQAHLDEIELNNIDFEVFKMSGKLAFTYSCATCKEVTGFAGNLSITVMSEVTLKMSAGFGKQKDNKGEYSWWFFDGACKFPGGIPLGAVSINGFSGGFAYNMKSKYSLTEDRYSAKGLLTQAETNTNPETVKSSGMDFEPSRGSWVANAGISMILTGAKNTLNADGLVSLRIVNQHFSGIFIEANAYVLTSMNESVTPGDASNNDHPLIWAKAIMGFETYNEYDYFRLSISAQADMNLANLLKGVSSTVLGDQIAAAIHEGTSLVTNSNIVSTLDEIGSKTGIISGLSSHGEGERNAAANASSGSSGSFGFNAKAQIPIDFELKHYKKTYDGHKKGSTDWYFAIGKPNYEDRVQLKKKLDLVVLTSESKFTFYLQTGNAFAYEMPPLSTELQEFFGFATDDKKLDANSEDVKKSRMINNSDWMKIDKGGGFCMGATFHALSEMNFFLYMKGSADLGFDVALLDVGGMGCPGYPEIGQHHFYALGRIYAALQADVGLKLNLGFWKGKFSLFSAGVGALLQGGGPNPSYCYGLLRFQVNLLDGLLKFSTSCDFMLGDVCVPGAGDPLANVKLFQNVTPGFETEAVAAAKENLQSSMQIGTIVSNMPWNHDVFLADNDGRNARKFRFQLMTDNCIYATRTNTNQRYANTTGNNRLRFTYSNKDENTMLFETIDGGFVPNAYNKITLQARAFEYRTSMKGRKDLLRVDNPSRADVMYNYATGTVSNSNPSITAYGWFDPIFFDDATNKYIVKPFIKDSTFYFKTHPLEPTLNDQVVMTWPYNGETHFPAKEYVHSASSSNAANLGYFTYHPNNSGPTPYCHLYLYRKRDDLFNKNTLAAEGKELKIYLLKNGLEDGEIAECPYTYYNSTNVPYVQIQLPNKEYGLPNGKGAHMLRFLIVESDAYNSALAAAQQAAEITRKQAEYSSRITDQTYLEAEAAHNRKNGLGGDVAGFGGDVISTGSGGDCIISGPHTGIAGSTSVSSGTGSAGYDGTIVSYGGTSNSRGQAFSSSSGTNATNSSGIIATNSGGSAYALGSRVTVVPSASSGAISISNEPSNSHGGELSAVANRGNRISGTGTGMTLATSNTKINIQDEMLDEIYMNKQSVGKDSMTYIRTMLKEGYKISSSIGQEIYTWTWFVDFLCETYTDMLTKYFNSDMSTLANYMQRTTVTDMTSYLKVKGSGNSNDPMGKMAFLFLKYNPEDAALYNTQCEMPPVCYFTIDRNGGSNLLAMHKRYFQHFLDLERDFKNTSLVSYFNSYKSADQIKYHSNNSGTDLFKNAASTKAEYNKIVKKGLYPNYTTSFLSINRRIKGGTNYTQCTVTSYHPTTYDVPCILETYADNQQREPMSELFFNPNYANAAPMYTPDYGKNWTWFIKDYASVAISDDIKKIHSFMSENQRHAYALDKRGWSNKRTILEGFFKAAKLNAFMSYSDFPYDMPEIYRATHFIKVLDDVVDYTRNNKSYTTVSGKVARFYNHNEDYIPVNELQQQDRYWAKYWWSADGQCLDLGPDGFDKSFYFGDKSIKYYNTLEASNANGVHKKSDNIEKILGDWYKNDPYCTQMWNSYVFVQVNICYITSQNSNFSDNLMKMAAAVKNNTVSSTNDPSQGDLVFFPNAVLTCPSKTAHYSINLNKLSTYSKFRNNLTSAIKLNISNSDY